MTIAKPRITTPALREVRTFATRLEARDLGGMEFKLNGYASVTGVRYDMGGGNSEIVQRGAFSRTLASNRWSNSTSTMDRVAQVFLLRIRGYRLAKSGISR